jgi:hypothetical protein
MMTSESDRLAGSLFAYEGVAGLDGFKRTL